MTKSRKGVLPHPPMRARSEDALVSSARRSFCLRGRFLISRTPRIPPHGTFSIADPAAASRHP